MQIVRRHWRIVFPIIIAIIIWVIFSMKRDDDISKKGIVTDAVVSRVDVKESKVDKVERKKEFFENKVKEEIETDYTYYVTFKTQDGKEVEARLGEVGTRRLNKGDSIRIKYLPGKTDYVLPELR